MPEAIGIIAGRGELPKNIISACAKKSIRTFTLGFEGIEPDEISADKIIRFGAIGEGLNAFRTAEVSEIVMAGRMKRPPLASLKPDAEGAKLLKRLGKTIFSGDDALLKTLITFIEEEGFKIIGAHEILGEQILAKPGTLGKIAPDAGCLADIKTGIISVKAHGAKDIGQAVVVVTSKVIDKEDKSGTDALIARCKLPNAILLKASKPNQELRVDMPTIGPDTIKNMAKRNFAGVAVEAGKTLILNTEETIRIADELGVFVYGFEP